MRSKSPPGNKSLREGTYFYGIKDFTEALTRWERAASVDNIEATLKAADLYCEGKQKLRRNPRKALQLYKKAALQAMDPSAQYKVGIMYYTGDGVEQSYENAKVYFELSAQEGWFNAELDLAKMYYEGKGVEKNYITAYHWYMKSENDPESQLGIAKLYHYGYDTFLPNPNRALEFYRKSAKTNADAQYCLGNIYYEGSLGVSQSYSLAQEYYAMAGNKDHVESLVSLGLMYLNGKGIRKDENKAVSLLKTALYIDDNHGHANFLLGNYLTERDQPNYTIALPHYYKASASHYSLAYLTLGKIYENGNGVPQDTDRAIRWYYKAVKAGIEEAQIELTRLQPKLNYNENQTLNIDLQEEINSLQEKLKWSECKLSKIEDELKEKDEKINLLKHEKAKMQDFQMQLVLEMAGKKEKENEFNKRKREL